MLKSCFSLPFSSHHCQFLASFHFQVPFLSFHSPYTGSLSQCTYPILSYPIYYTVSLNPSIHACIDLNRMYRAHSQSNETRVRKHKSLPIAHAHIYHAKSIVQGHSLPIRHSSIYQSACVYPFLILSFNHTIPCVYVLAYPKA